MMDILDYYYLNLQSIPTHFGISGRGDVKVMRAGHFLKIYVSLPCRHSAHWLNFECRAFNH